jgi:hypothetical protein
VENQLGLAVRQLIHQVNMSNETMVQLVVRFVGVLVVVELDYWPKILI